MNNNSNSPEFQKALKELKIKPIPNYIGDVQELNLLILSILCYPSREKADIHHRSNNIGKNDLIVRQKQNSRKMKNNKYNKDNNLTVCECCGVLANNDKLPYCTSFDKLNIGLGVHMFFKNHLFQSLMFLLLFCAYSIYALITNIVTFNNQNLRSSMCTVANSTSIASQVCLSSIGAGSKVINYSTNSRFYTMIQSWIGVGFVVIWGFIYILKTYIQQKYTIQVQQKNINATDFTLLLTHIPHSYFVKRRVNDGKISKSVSLNTNKSYGQYGQKKDKSYEYLNQQELRFKFNKQFIDYQRQKGSSISYQVVKVNVAKPLYNKKQEDIKKQAEVNKNLNKRLDVFREYLRQRRDNKRFLVPKQIRDKKYQQFNKFYFRQFQNVVNKKDIGYASDNVVFVTLKYSQAVTQIVKSNRPPSISNFWNCCKTSQFPIPNVKVRRAPYPYQIKWDSVGFPMGEKRLRRFVIWFFTIILIAISLGLSIWVAFKGNTYTVGISIAISVIISVINIGMQITIAFLSYYQNEYIQSREQTSIALKIAMSQLANSILVPIFVTLIAQSSDQFIDISKIGLVKVDKPWLKTGGLVDDVFFIAAINIFIPLSLFLDPWEIYLRLKRWWYTLPYNRIQIYQQKQFNKLFGNYTFDIGYEYAYLIKTAIFTAFYVCTQPIIALFAPIGIIIYYFATKKNLFSHFQRPKYHFPYINKTMDILLLFSLIAFGLGCLFAHNFIPNRYELDVFLPNLIITGIGLFFMLFVPLRIFYYCMKKPSKQSRNLDYSIERKHLFTDYDRLNPVTKQQAIGQFKNYLQQQQKKSPLDDQAINVQQTIMRQNLVIEREKEQNDIRASKIQQVRSSMRHIDETPQPMYNNDLQEYKEIANTVRLPPDQPKLQSAPVDIIQRNQPLSGENIFIPEYNLNEGAPQNYSVPVNNEHIAPSDNSVPVNNSHFVPTDSIFTPTDSKLPSNFGGEPSKRKRIGFG